MAEIKPDTEITDIDLAFPASVRHLMPDYDEIPDEYKKDSHWAVKFQRSWFFNGIKSYSFSWKDDIDGKTAMRHLSCIQGSFEPKHEHKEAAVAYLLDQWTDGEGTWEEKR